MNKLSYLSRKLRKQDELRLQCTASTRRTFVLRILENSATDASLSLTIVGHNALQSHSTFEFSSVRVVL